RLHLPKPTHTIEESRLANRHGSVTFGGALEQLRGKPHLPPTLSCPQIIIFKPLALTARQLVPHVLIRHFINYRIKLLHKRRFAQQPNFKTFFVHLRQLPKQIQSYFVLLVSVDGGNSSHSPLITMTLNRDFVFALMVNTPKYAFFEVHTQMMRTRTQGALGDRELGCHLPVMHHFFLSVVTMIVKNKLLLVSR